MADPLDVVGAARYAAMNYDNPNPEKQKLAVESAHALNLGITELSQLKRSFENPEDPTAVSVKDRIFTKIAESQPAMDLKVGGPLKAGERFTVKNLINENPALQKIYLERKGYQTRQVGEDIEVRLPGDQYFQKIDPAGLDPWDVTDITGDVIKGIVEGAGTGLKIAGAGLGGGVGAVVGGAAAGLLSGLTETARQGIGIATGVRDKLDVPLIRNEAITGGLIGGSLKAGGEALLGSAAKSREAVAAKLAPRPEAGQITEAYNAMGTQPSPGLLRNDMAVRQTEDALIRSPTAYFPTTRAVKEQAASQINAMNKTAENVFQGAAQKHFGTDVSGVQGSINQIKSNADAEAKMLLSELPGAKKSGAGQLIPQAGGEIKNQVTERLNTELTRIEGLYKEIEQGLKSDQLVPNTRGLIRSLQNMRSPVRPSLNAKIDGWIELAGNIQTMDQLKEFGSEIADQIYGASKGIKAAGSQTIKAAHELRDQTFARAIENKMAQVQGKIDKGNVLGAVNKNEELNDLVNLYNKLDEASKSYRTLNENIDWLVKRPGADPNFAKSAAKKIEAFAKSAPEKIYELFSTPKDYEKAQWLKEVYPKEFERAASAKLSSIWLEAAQSDKSLTDVILKSLRDLTDSEKLALLGENANRKIVNLSDLSRNVKDKEKLADLIIGIDSTTKNIQQRYKAFGEAFTNKIKNMDPVQKELIFGKENLPQVEALLTAHRFQLDLVNPSRTSIMMNFLNRGERAAMKSEGQLVEAYKRNITNPEIVGRTKNKVGSTLISPATFGTIEGTRSTLFGPPTFGANNTDNGRN